MSKIIALLTGYPGAGKTTVCKDFIEKGFYNFNRDASGGSLDDLNKRIEYVMKNDNTGKYDKIVVDNTYPTIASRKPVVIMAMRYGYDLECYTMSTSIEEAQVNNITRQIERYGEVMTPEKLKAHPVAAKDPNMVPIAALYKYKKEYEKPTEKEGFSKVFNLPFTRNYNLAVYVNKAIILDYDGTVRETISGSKWPLNVDDIRIRPNVKETIQKYIDEGYKVFGATNQSWIGKGTITEQAFLDGVKKTNDLLGLDIEVQYCPHSVPPIICYCRKPGPAMGVYFIEKYKLNPKECIMVGDATSDKTFATRCGFQFIHEEKFFI